MCIAAAIAGGAILGAAVDASSASKASKAAGRQFGLEERALSMEERRDAQRQQYVGWLDALINRPQDVAQQTPGFQFGLDQGTEAVRRKMAASGFAGSGNMATALMEYGQGYSQTFYQQQAQLLGQLAGLMAPPQNVSSPGYGQTGANLTQQSSDAWGRALSNIGYAAGQYSNAGFNQPPLMMSGDVWYPTGGGGYGYNMPGG